MATVAEVMDVVARRCRVAKPNAWVAATQLTYMELKDLLQETVDELLDRVDWPDPISKSSAISGTGDETYSLPSEFKRLTRADLSVYETTTSRRAVIPVSSRGAWTHLQDLGTAGNNRYYRLAGDEESGFEISFFQDLESGSSITVSYVSKNWLTIAGTEGSAWTDEGATLLLPRRLIELGVVWRWRREKGLPFTDRMAEYEAVLMRQATDRLGVRTICFGDSPEPSHPMRVAVPDYIPGA